MQGNFKRMLLKRKDHKKNSDYNFLTLFSSISVYNRKGGLISRWLNKENNKLRDEKIIFTLHIPP
jgi:hypothetical protein